MLKYPNVLLLNNDAQEAGLLLDILREQAVLTHARSMTELEALLENNTYDAFLCAWSCEVGNWDECLKKVQKLQPDLPVIVVSRTGGEKEWTAVLEAGAFDLLVPAYGRGSALGILEQAAASRELKTSRNLIAR
jgi:DNA-binding NtrC family response regulator